jgi:cell division protein ZapA
MSSVNVTINGKSYRMACDDGQEQHLLGLADELNGIIYELRGAFGEIGDLRLIVMAAITIADELSEARRRAGLLEIEVGALKQTGAAASIRAEATDAELSAAISGVARRITDIARRLNTEQ